MSELPSYLDLANEECGPFVLAYPNDVGGAEVAVGAFLPGLLALAQGAKLLEALRSELDAGRRVLVFLRHTGNRGFVARLRRLIAEALGEAPTFLDPAKVPTASRERWLDGLIERGRPPKAVETGLNNLVAFHNAVWYKRPRLEDRSRLGREEDPASLQVDGFSLAAALEAAGGRSRRRAASTPRRRSRSGRRSIRSGWRS